MPSLRGAVQSTLATHPGDERVSLDWGGARFEPDTTALQIGVLPLCHLAGLLKFLKFTQ